MRRLIKNGVDETVGHINEDEAKRGIVACKTLLPLVQQFEVLLSKIAVLEERSEEKERLTRTLTARLVMGYEWMPPQKVAKQRGRDQTWYRNRS